MIYIHYEFELYGVKSPIGIIICSKTDDLAPLKFKRKRVSEAL